MAAMEPRFIPLSQVPAAPVIDFLATVGVAPEIARWKYFDEQLARDRGTRGLVILRGDRVVGFLGLTRFAYGSGEQTWSCYWLTDWFKSKDAGKGAGRRLFDECLRTCRITAAVGGSPVSRYLFPQLATLMAPSAYMALRLPLRLGAALDVVSRHVGRRVLDRLPRAMANPVADLGARAGALVGPIPLRPTPARSSGHVPVVIEPGVARALEPLLHAGPGTAPERAPGPHYDFDYIDWQVGRCPVLESATSHVRDRHGAQAAVLLWRRRPAGRTWRMALFARPGAETALAAAVDEAVAHAHARGAVAVSALVSRRDRAWIALLAKRGFLTARSRLPFWLFRHRDATEPVHEWAHLSYLDADLAYRFS